jgi:hypothetical protein
MRAFVFMRPCVAYRELHPTDIIFGGRLINWKDPVHIEGRSMLHAKGIVRLSLPPLGRQVEA